MFPDYFAISLQKIKLMENGRFKDPQDYFPFTWNLIGLYPIKNSSVSESLVFIVRFSVSKIKQNITQKEQN